MRWNMARRGCGWKRKDGGRSPGTRRLGLGDGDASRFEPPRRDP